MTPKNEDIAPAGRIVHTGLMSNSLMNSSGGGSATKGVLPAVASAVLPGLGQLINGQGDKALGVFVVATLAGFGFWSAIPVIGTLAGIAAGGTWIYGVADGYLTGRKKR